MNNLTPELEADLRKRINPGYVDTEGTESYERKALLDEIDRLRDALQNIRGVDHGEAYVIASEALGLVP